MAVLALALVTALSVVEARHRNRLAFAQLQTLRAEQDALDTEWGRLLLEQGAWAEHRRVEGLAQNRLDMTLPRADQVVIVRGDAPLTQPGLVPVGRRQP